MSKITIHNIGSIKEVTLELNKVNIIMGPQSSGKSTIAKIINYCQWVEKRFVLDGEFKYDFSEKFMEFHKISNAYFNENSMIEYKSEVVELLYKWNKTTKKIGNIKIKNIKNGSEFINTKNIYIPAERNFVSAIPNLGKFKGTNDNLMNFLFDWYEVKNKFTNENKFVVPNHDMSYYHLQSSDSDILFLNSMQQELLLNNASSGLQSVIPMLILVEYLTNGLYHEKVLESYEEKQEIINVFIKHFSQIIKSERMNELKNQFNKEKNLTLTNEESEKVLKLILARKKYHYSQFIIEEPEQNLFPEAQRDLIYYIFDKINNTERNHKLLITTHSPYILYAINNCMMGFVVKDNITEEIKNELISKKSWINPKLVSIWEIENGTIKNIQDTKTGTVSKHYFNKIMNDVMNEYYEMLNYLEI